MLNSVYFQTVGFQRASLGKRFLAEIAFVGSDTGMRPRMSFQIERVVEPFAAEGA